MEGTDVKICRLCLTINSNLGHYMLVGEVSNMLDLFLPKSQFIVSEPSICGNCISKLEIGYKFKLNCINNEKKIQTYINSFKNDFHLERSKLEIICCLCFNNYSRFNKLCVLAKYLKAYLPELDLQKNSDAVVCNSCTKVVHSTYNFINLYLEVERKLNQYMSVENFKDIHLNKMLKFLKITKIGDAKESYENEIIREVSELDRHGDCESRISTLKTEIVYKNTHQIETHYFQQGETGALLDENVVPFEPHYLEALNQPVNINQRVNEDGSVNLTINDISLKKFNCKYCSYIASTKNELNYHYFDHKNMPKMYSCKFCSFVTKYRNVIDNHNITHLKEDEIVWYNCDICTYRAKIQGNLEKHKLTHNKHNEELKKYKCEECPYKTMWKRDLERHVVKHNQIAFSCEQCIFSTKHQRYLKQHIIRIHGTKDNSSGETYYCANCSYSTKNKRCLIPHMITHRKVEDVVWYKCQFCKYKSIWKRSLRVHEVIHLKKFKCNQCDFETTLKRFLKEHLRGHLPITLYSCETCDFTTHVKQTMNNHNNKHKKPEELQTYYCKHCKYQSKRLQDLKQHAIIHKDNPEWLKCSTCSYRTICKKRLKNHQKLMHGESSQIKMFQCSLCPFTTKYKTSFMNHQLCLHKEKDESNLIKCPKCYYKCYRKELFTRHLLVHKKLSDEEMFRCYHCDYKTKYKRALVKHIKGHQNLNANEDPILQCSKCDFSTKWRQSLKQHMLKHPADVEEVKMEIDVAETEIVWGPNDECFSSDIKENVSS
ncbi:zinc finger protein 11-like [Diorhabda carinulata]|uniref:zinc finger protein 11-like n=1 Tax=Diorhabda carinulata TaxID=1163345 RepID=UPI0025A19924|nr:zinc finger protein 11-like [Diorhabda carinulata]